MNSLKTTSLTKIKTAGISLLVPGLIMLFVGLNQNPPTGDNDLHFSVIIGLAFQLAGVILLGINYYKTNKEQLYIRLFIAILMLALVTVYLTIR
ncbi:hypothetical protein ABID22_000560 [Pontibacter aydingkolensis]|uniref:Uncharacterized protein n=1 Tax=Pontibacter aydingkolensis TaxID=1911536 RepID=A0ABS7CRZ3_9BACT|nr:hypothetical protein [Pontibacter aydingkolensis]MBW7466558.1 hypothetical protein [Pontibacter aydingkolensis]